MDNPNTENPTPENPEAAPPTDGQTAPAATIDTRCMREVEVEIPADIVTKRQDAVVRQYSQQVRLPGFRKGKAPATIVRNRFSAEIKNELLESLVPQYFRQAVTEAGFRPVGPPRINNLEMEPGHPIRFKASFEILPEFQLGDYQSIQVEKPKVAISDEQVQGELTRLQQQQASFDPVNDDRPLADGDFAQVSFQAVPKETATEEKPEAAAEPPAPAAQPVQMDEVLVEIGGANTIPEFSENLRGAKAGEERQFDVSYPPDFYDKRLAGKQFSYTVKVNALKKKTLPELNDDFARELSQEIQTLDDLKNRIREGMEAQQTQQAEHEAKEKLIDQLIEKHDFPVPNVMVEHQIDLRLERGLRALAAQGMRTEDMRRMDFRRLRAAQRQEAVKEVKSGLLLQKIADAENLQVSEEELQNEISDLARHTNQSPDEVRRTLSEDDGLERIRTRMRTEKALNFLYSKSG